MSGFTKEIIVQTLMVLLNEKPLGKITVKDIVERCGVNRNTFYYHFRDIPDVVEYIMKREADTIIEEQKSLKSVGECLDKVLLLFKENRKAMLHIYRSVQRDVFVQYLDSISQYMTTQYFDQVAEKEGTISPEKKKSLVYFYKCLFVGIALDWLDHGMEYDLSADVAQFEKLYDVINRTMIEG